jgi:hypothetical protein
MILDEGKKFETNVHMVISLFMPLPTVRGNMFESKFKYTLPG